MSMTNESSALAEDQLVDALIALKQVKAACGFSKSSIYRMMDRGEFPRPAKKAGRSVRWRQSMVQAWIRNEWTPAA